MTTRGVRGTGEGPESSDAKKTKKSVDSDAFKDMMKVGKVREVDPEEQRKRKQKQEAEQEAAAAQVQAAPLQPIQTSAPTDDGGFKIQLSALGEGVPSTPDEFSEESIGTSAESPMYFASSEEEAPPPMPQEAPSAPPPPFVPTEQFISGEGYLPQEEEVGLSSSGQAQTPEQQPEAKKTGRKKKAAPGEAVKKAGAKKVAPPKQIVKAVAPEKTAAPPPSAFPEKREVFTERLAGPAPKKEEIEEVEEAEMVQAPLLPQGSWEKIKEKEKEKISAPAETQAAAPGTPLPIPDVIPPQISAATPYAALHPQVWDLFERMVGVMTIMTSSGISETTINLTGDQFKASPFFGTQIVIREYATAPKNFNIEMLIPSQVTKTVERNYNDLLAAFQAGNYTFKVNRLEWRELPVEKKRKVEKVKKKREEEE